MNRELNAVEEIANIKLKATEERINQKLKTINLNMTKVMEEGIKTIQEKKMIRQ